MKPIYREIFVCNALQRILVKGGDIYTQIKLGLTTRVHCSRYNYEIVTILLKFLWLITSKRLSLFPLENRDEKTSFQDGDCWVHTSHNGIQVLAILTRYSGWKVFHP